MCLRGSGFLPRLPVPPPYKGYVGGVFMLRMELGCLFGYRGAIEWLFSLDMIPCHAWAQIKYEYHTWCYNNILNNHATTVIPQQQLAINYK